jgi:hypothetical protein
VGGHWQLPFHLKGRQQMGIREVNNGCTTTILWFWQWVCAVFLKIFWFCKSVKTKFAERNAFYTEKHIKVSKFFSKKFSKIVVLELPRHIWIVDDALLLILQHQGFSFLTETMRIFLKTLSIVHYSFFGSIYSQHLHKLFVVLVWFHIMSTFHLVFSYHNARAASTHVSQIIN